MSDDPYRPPTHECSHATESFASGNVNRPLSISILAWFLILNGIRHAMIIWNYDGEPVMPLDARILSLVIDGGYLLSGWGLLGMRKWAVLLYFAAHSITIAKVLLYCSDIAVLVHYLASIRLLWLVIVPIGMLTFAVPRWRRMNWM